MSTTGAGFTSKPVDFLSIVYHIALLRWFSELGLETPTDDALGYLLQAEKRYEAWWDMLKETKPDPEAIIIPPIDVVLMWHTHMLNPRQYQEDLYRMTKDHSLHKYELPLKRINTVFMRRKAADPMDVKTWSLFTNLPYELKVTDSAPEPWKVACPWCQTTFDIPHISYVDIRTNPKPKYSAGCPDCHCQYFPDMVSAKAFWDDWQAWTKDTTVGLRGAYLDTKSGDWDLDGAAEKMEKLHALFQELEAIPPDSWSSCDWGHILRYFSAAQSLLDIRNRHEHPFTLGTAQIEKAYRDVVGPFSVSLWSSALYNFKTIKRILPNFWASSDVTKRHANRYHAYLVALNEHDQDLPSASGFEPDIAWLTHMLRPAHYREYTLMFTQRVIELADRVALADQVVSTGSHDEYAASHASHDSSLDQRTRGSATPTSDSTPVVMSLSDIKFMQTMAHQDGNSRVLSHKGSLASFEYKNKHGPGHQKPPSFDVNTLCPPMPYRPASPSHSFNSPRSSEGHEPANSGSTYGSARFQHPRFWPPMPTPPRPMSRPASQSSLASKPSRGWLRKLKLFKNKEPEHSRRAQRSSSLNEEHQALITSPSSSSSYSQPSACPHPPFPR